MRVVERADRNDNEPWCRSCRHFYWHGDECELGKEPPKRVEHRCPSCGTAIEVQPCE